MNRKMIIEKNALTLQLAVLKDDEMTQFYVSSLSEGNIQGKVVIGQVMQVVKNLNAVFVDYGDEKNGLLHFKQIPQLYQNKVQPGMRLAVQIIKQNIGEKGHKLTAKLNFSGRYMVCLPFEPGIHVSKKITDKEIRERIKTGLEALENPDDYGFIVRTHAQKVPMAMLYKDAIKLMERVKKILAVKDYLTKGTVLEEEPPMVQQIALDHLASGQAYEVICNDETFLKTLERENAGYPDHEETHYTLYDTPLSIWSAFGLLKKKDQLLKRKIWLKNGGNLIIDYTEAMTVIDVNSAKAVMTKNPAKAVLELNREAVRESLLQILRRNLSGMILIDLVEMKDPEHRQNVYDYAKMLIESYEDHQTKVYPLTELGLMQFSRTKKYQCLPHQLLDACSDCHAPYTRYSFLKEMMDLEEKLKTVQLSDSRQDVYLEAGAEDIEQMHRSGMISRLEKAYPVTFHLIKKEHEKNKRILCQFYAKQH